MSGTKRALREVLEALDGWIEGAQSNHEALGHRDAFESCCGTFHPDDIRNMVTDAARSIKEEKKRRKAPARPAVMVEVKDGIAGSVHERIITPGDTFTFTVQGFLISLDGTKPVAKIDVPVTIRARIA